MGNYEEIKRGLYARDKGLEAEYQGLQPIYEIKEQVIRIRNKQGLSQAQLAEKAGRLI
jgi:hypothetical protein